MDPLVLKAISIAFGVLLLCTTRHKLASREHFRAVLADYRVMPPAFVPAAAWAVTGVEGLLGCGWLLSGFVPAVAAATGAATAALLSVYTLAIAINLLRGRVFISCGCGLSVAHSDGQPLSWGLVSRNLLLVALAFMATVPLSPRTQGLVDYLTLAAMLPVLALLYLAANQLLANAAAINSWRRVRG